MSAFFNNQVDKEMTVFTGTIHQDNLEQYYAIFSDMLLNPAWDESDFERVKNNLINYQVDIPWVINPQPDFHTNPRLSQKVQA